MKLRAVDKNSEVLADVDLNGKLFIMDGGNIKNKNSILLTIKKYGVVDHIETSFDDDPKRIIHSDLGGKGTQIAPATDVVFPPGKLEFNFLEEAK